MFSAISQKHVLGYNFGTNAARMMILVSRNRFLGSRNQMAPFILMVCLFVCLSVYLSAHLAVCWLSIFLSLSRCLPICLHVNLLVKKPLAVCTNATYGYIMFSTISQKHVFAHSFLAKSHTMKILVSRTMFWGSRNQTAAFGLLVGLSVCPSVYLFAHLSLSQSVQSLSVFNLSVFSLSTLCPVQLSVEVSYPTVTGDYSCLVIYY